MPYKKLGDNRKVFIAYPAILKYIDEGGRQKMVGEEDLKKLKGKMTKIHITRQRRLYINGHYLFLLLT